MKLELKQIGGSMSRPASIIELVVECNNGFIHETITKLDGSVDIELIHSLRQIADRLEEQNNLAGITGERVRKFGSAKNYKD